ncbi:MAG: DUF6898 family protein [Rickettsiales bacterium]
MTKNSEEVAFEFVRIGNYVKVSAIDMVSGKEVSIVGDPKAGEAELKRIALAKLKKIQN